MSDRIGQGVFVDGESAMQFLGGVLEAATEYSIIATDVDGVIQLWNEGARRLYGYSASEIIGQSQSVLHTEEDALRGLPKAMMSHAREHGKWEGTVERMRQDGTTFTARVVLTLRHGADAEPTGFLLMSSDVTNERQLAADWERSQYTLSVLESAPDAMVIVNDAGEVQLANTATAQLFGYSSGELVGQKVEMLIPDRYHDRHPRHRAAFFAEPLARPIGAGLELWGKHKDGTEFPVEISLSPFATDDGGLATAAIRDVTESKLFERELQDANAKLERANLAKNNFLASMSHELRTPLNAILGFTGTMLMGLPGPLNDEQTKQLRTVQTSGRHLLSLINDLLDLARIEAGKLELKIEPIACAELLDEVAVGLRPLADAKGIELSVSAPEDPLEVRSDRRALSQILINLANNAIKFTDEGGVRLEVNRHNGDQPQLTTFTVTDTGRGIKADDQAWLFDAFEQVASSGTGQYEGTGLGLHICRALATLIGASITFESEFGKGSAFSLELRD